MTFSIKSNGIDITYIMILIGALLVILVILLYVSNYEQPEEDLGTKVLRRWRALPIESRKEILEILSLQNQMNDSVRSQFEKLEAEDQKDMFDTLLPFLGQFERMSEEQRVAWNRKMETVIKRWASISQREKQSLVQSLVN